MRRTISTQLLVSLPLLTLPLLLSMPRPALAAGSPALEAVTILARARASNGKCQFLSAGERAELGHYAARAEMASASQTSPALTRAAVAAGVAQGQGASCNGAERADVRETLQAAREAVAEANRTPRRRTAVRATADAPPRDGGGLGFYARVVSAYYLERQCRSLGPVQGRRFWKRIVAVHEDAVSRFGKAAVAPLKARAASEALGDSCGSRTMARIAGAYEEVSRR